MVTVPVIGEKGVKINVNEPKKANFPSRKLTKLEDSFLVGILMEMCLLDTWKNSLSMTFLQLKHLKINKKRD